MNFEIETPSQLPNHVSNGSRAGRKPSALTDTFLKTAELPDDHAQPVTVATDDVDKFRQRIRAVAYKHGHGARIWIEPVDGTDADGRAQTRVWFRAVEKRARRANGATVEEAPTKPASKPKASTATRKTK